MRDRGGAHRGRVADCALAEVIADYVRDHVRIGRTKAQVLRVIAAAPIAGRRVSEIRSADLIGLARELAKDREPATVQNYLSHLGGVLRVARASLSIGTQS